MLQNIYLRPRLFFFVFITAITIVYWVFPDIMPFNYGFGFEGFTIYKPYAKDVTKYLFDEKMNSYSIQRIFPYTLLYIYFKLFDIKFEDTNMLLFFQLLQLAVGYVIIYVWDKLADKLDLNINAKWIGYICLLINFAILKHDYYIPFTYDRLAVGSGLVSLYFYFTNNKLGLLVNSVLALMIWPTAIVFNLIMMAIPARIAAPRQGNNTLASLWALGVAAGMCGLFVLIIYIKHIPDNQSLAPAIHKLIPISIVIVFAYLIFTQYQLAKRVFPSWEELIEKIKEVLVIDVKWVNALVLIGCYVYLTRVLGDSTHPYLTPQQFAINFTYGALQRPLQSLICHTVYYGLPIVMLVIFWKRIPEPVNKLGLGSGLMLMAVLVQAVNNETRQMANVLPVMALFVAVASQSFVVDKRIIFYTLGIVFVLSKGWLYLNIFDPYSGHVSDIYPMTHFEKGAFLKWPQQAYFMNFGPWSATPYLIGQGVFVLLVMAVMYQMWVRNSEKHGEVIS